MNNLYYIQTEQGKRILFNLNWAQKELYDNLHNCLIILKARQLGCTTFFSILLLDHILWKNNIHAAIIAHTRDDCTSIFKTKLKYAFDNLRPDVRSLFRTVGDSASELSFAHGSSIRVGTSMRSSTLQYLHISEFGKICAKYPEKAAEIVSGSLNTVAAGQHIYIESTAEGKEGAYHDMVQEAIKRAQYKKEKGEPYFPLDFKFFFLTWWRHPTYSSPYPYPISADLHTYFCKLELSGIHLTEQQKWWYAAKESTQHEHMQKEYPSTPEEAFNASQEGYWYVSYLKEVRDARRIRPVAYDRALPVHTASDLGQKDAMATWFFQVNRSDEINIIDFWQKTDCPIDQYAAMLKDKGYTYGIHLWPHDANARDRAGITFVQQAIPFNLRGIVLEPASVLNGINEVRTLLSKCWFDEIKCADGLKALENYKKKWNSTFGGFTSEPVHDDASHPSDAFRYLAQGIKMVRSASGSSEDEARALRKYFG